MEKKGGGGKWSRRKGCSEGLSAAKTHAVCVFLQIN